MKIKSIFKILPLATIILYNINLPCNSSDFSLKIGQKSVIMKNSYLTVQTFGFNFKVKTDSGNFGFVYRSGKNEIIDSITEVQNTESVKTVEIKSKPFVWNRNSRFKFYVRLKILKDYPMLFIKTKLKNIGNSPANAYYFWRMSQAQSDIYISKGNFVVNSPGKLYIEDWAFFPSQKGDKGVGLILNTDASGLKLWTAFPNKNWTKLGWYICRNNPKLPVNKENNIDFIFLTTPSLNRFIKYYKEGLNQQMFKDYIHP